MQLIQAQNSQYARRERIPLEQVLIASHTGHIKSSEHRHCRWYRGDR